MTEHPVIMGWQTTTSSKGVDKTDTPLTVNELFTVWIWGTHMVSHSDPT
ncbi:hypothetical protein [Ruminococcus sp. FC2018]|nr:hypothetical protein [Ruminococcus sp. FC2018]